MKAVNGICKRCHRLRHCGLTGYCGVCSEILREDEKRRPSLLEANVMDALDGPVCGCGRPSTHESGWCGTECEAKFGNTVLVVREVERAPIECECTGWTMVGYPGSAYDPSWLEGLDEVYGHHPSCEKYKAP